MFTAKSKLVFVLNFFREDQHNDIIISTIRLTIVSYATGCQKKMRPKLLIKTIEIDFTPSKAAIFVSLINFFKK